MVHLLPRPLAGTSAGACLLDRIQPCSENALRRLVLLMLRQPMGAGDADFDWRAHQAFAVELGCEFLCERRVPYPVAALHQDANQLRHIYSMKQLSTGLPGLTEPLSAVPKCSILYIAVCTSLTCVLALDASPWRMRSKRFRPFRDIAAVSQVYMCA